MIFDQAAGPRGIEEDSEREIGGGFGGSDGIECKTCVRREGLEGALIARRDGGQDAEQRLGKRKCLRRQRFQYWVKALCCRRDQRSRDRKGRRRVWL